MIRSLLRRRVRAAGGGGVFDVPLLLSRLAAGTGSTVVTGAVPLAAGDLPSGGAFALFVGGVEVAASLSTTGRPHPDGSARAVLVQHTRSLTFDGDVAAVLKLGTVQTLTASYAAQTFAALTATVGVWQTQTPIAGVVISTDSVRTCASGMLGPLTVRPSSIPVSPSWMAVVETRFDTIHEDKYAEYNGSLVSGGYGQYDPIYQNLVRWARTGNVNAFKQALRVYGVRRSEYFLPNDWNANLFIMHHQGLGAGSLLFGDNQARERFLFRTTDGFCLTAGYLWPNAVDPTTDVSDSRTSAAILYQLIVTDRNGDGLVVANGSTVRDWIRLWALRIVNVATQWTTEGAGRISWKTAPDPPWSNNFMNNLLLDALAIVHDEYLTDTAERALVRTRITEFAEWMWQTQFFPSATPSPYFSLASRIVPSYTTAFPEPAVDVTGLHIGPMMWLAKTVDRSTWQTRADVLFDVVGRSPMNGTDAPYMDVTINDNVSGKICNETFFLMGRSLAWRT